MGNSSVFLVAFLGAAVEVIEMAIIIVGVGTIRGWRSTWLGAGAGLGVLAVLVVALGSALQAVPIDLLRLLIGALLLIFGLQWLRKGIRRVSANGLRGMGRRDATAERVPASGVDWTAFVLSMKGSAARRPRGGVHRDQPRSCRPGPGERLLRRGPRLRRHPRRGPARAVGGARPPQRTAARGRNVAVELRDLLVAGGPRCVVARE